MAMWWRVGLKTLADLSSTPTRRRPGDPEIADQFNRTRLTLFVKRAFADDGCRLAAILIARAIDALLHVGKMFDEPPARQFGVARPDGVEEELMFGHAQLRVSGADGVDESSVWKTIQKITEETEQRTVL